VTYNHDHLRIVKLTSNLPSQLVINDEAIEHFPDICSCLAMCVVPCVILVHLNTCEFEFAIMYMAKSGLLVT
jgi:hypothetical protein